MKLKKLLLNSMAFVMLTSAFSVPVFAKQNIVAFPGAEGGGMYTQGARTGSGIEIYHVTNLNDSGTGSLRDAVSCGNRIIVFDVAGTIMLESELKISASNLTVLGQTSPGEGICIGGESVRFSGANEIILRYLRFRMGDKSTSEEDALGIRNGKNIIIDHCSISWSVDECLSMYETMNTTVQNCIISDSLKLSNHSKGAHGYGGIWGGINASFHHNLLANNDSRNPRIGTSYTVSNYQGSADTDNLIDIRNNVIYNWGKNSGYGGENGVRVNLVNNYYKPSDLTEIKKIHFFEPYGGTDSMSTTLHLSGNVMEGNPAMTEDNWLGVSSNYSNGWTKRTGISDVATGDLAQKPNDEYLSAYPVATSDAEAAYNYVLENAGASIFRDSVDSRVVDNVKNGTYPTGSNGSTHFVDSQSDDGNWPALHGLKKQDSDNDGMSDEWEAANGLDINTDEAAVIAANGYTNIENYANYLAGLTYSGYEVNTLKLKEKLETAKSLDPSAYSEADRVKLSEAIAAADAVYNLSAPTQAQVDEQYNNLSAVLDLICVDYTDTLMVALEAAKKADTTDCTNESIAELNSAIEKAEKDLAEKNTAEYKDDAAALDTAVSKLKKGSKEYLRSVINFVESMDFSHLIYTDRQKAEAELAAAKAVLNDTSATNSEISNAGFCLQENLRLGHYSRINNGVVVEMQDFERGEAIDGEDKYRFEGKAPIAYTVIDGFRTNSSKVLQVTPDGYNNTTYLKNMETEPEHFMVSVDHVTIMGSDDLLIKVGRYCLRYDNLVIGYGIGGMESLDPHFLQFLNPYVDWINVAIEVDKPNNKVIFYVNNIPLGISEYDGSDLSEYGFAVSKRGDSYYDNLKVADLSSEPTYLMGDCNNSGDVTAMDAAQCLTRVIMGDELTELEKVLGSEALNYIDMDGSGQLTSNDAAMILAEVLKG